MQVILQTNFCCGIEICSHKNVVLSSQARVLTLTGTENHKHMPTQTATILDNNKPELGKTGYLLIGEQGQVHGFGQTKHDVIKLATRHSIRLVNEASPKHKTYIDTFLAKKNQSPV